MLANRTASQRSTFVILNKDTAGVKIEAVSASWELFDERGQSIETGSVTGFNPADDSVTFEIDAASLVLSNGDTASGRELVVYLTAADTELFELRDYFLVVSSQPLALMENSFVSYPEALAIRQEFGSLDGWDLNDTTRQSSALAEAYRRLCRMSFKVPGYSPTGDDKKSAMYGLGSSEPWFSTGRIRVAALDIAAFDALPETFRRSLKRAQMAEANTLLGGDPIGEKRKSGLISETVGESSGFFSSKPYLNLPISRQAYEEVKRYVFLRIGISRG